MRLFWNLIAFVFMGLGLMGLVFLANDIADPLFIYPGNSGPLHAIICIIMGIVAFLFWWEARKEG